MDIFNKAQEIKYIPTIKRQQELIERLFKTRHNQEIRTNHSSIEKVPTIPKNFL